MKIVPGYPGRTSRCRRYSVYNIVDVATSINQVLEPGFKILWISAAEQRVSENSLHLRQSWNKILWRSRKGHIVLKTGGKKLFSNWQIGLGRNSYPPRVGMPTR
eukprot:1512201-Rhodomonas_salina.2